MPTTTSDVVVLVGNPRPRSRTALVAERVSALLAPHAEPVVLDLAGLVDELGAPFGPDAGARWAGTLDRVLSARLLVVATPAYKGSYTGLLKSVLDLVEAGALGGVTTVPVLTVGGPAHTLAADVHLRPLLLELGASLPTTSLVVGAADLDAPDEVVSRWARANAAVLRRHGLGADGRGLEQVPA